MRFRNPALPHRTQQIAMDGSQKLPQRLLGTVRDRLAGGGRYAHLALAVAGWIRYASGIDEAGKPIAVSDPMAATFAAIAQRAGGDPARLAEGFLDLTAVFGDDLSAHPRLPRCRDAQRRGALLRDGVRKTLARTWRTPDGRPRTDAPNTRVRSRRHRTSSPCRYRSISIRTGSSRPTRRRARWPARLYATVKDLPIVSPHGHTDPQWFADDAPFANASALFITPDHYVFRMLYSQGVRLEDLGIPRRDGAPVEQDARKIWRTFAAHYHLFRGTPTRMWLDHAFATVFGIDERLTPESADRYFDRINACLAAPGVPAARAVRALQHRGDRDHRVAARSARPSPEDPRSRLEGARRHRLPARSRSSIPSSRASATTSQRFGALTGENTRPGAATSPRTATAARSSRRWARRRPTTAIRRRRPATSPRRTASGCSTARSPARSRRPRPSSSAARC